MNKAGGILGLIGGIFGVFAALATLFIGGVGTAFNAQGYDTIIGLGWGGIGFSIAVIVCAAITFAYPRGAGAALLLMSVLGAVLGGAFVAICMILSAIGGILAVAGGAGRSGGLGVQGAAAQSTNNPAFPVADVAAGIDAGAKSYAWVGYVGLVVAVAAVGIVAITVNSPRLSEKPATAVTADSDKSDALANAQPSALRADGELAELFSFGSKNTDLQRDNKLREIKGQIVAWDLHVYEVSRSGDEYQIQSSPNINFGSIGSDGIVGAIIYVKPRNPEEERLIASLKTDDIVSFKGYISDSVLRNLIIKPAVLVSQAAPAPALSTPQPPTDQTSATPGAKDEVSLFLADCKEFSVRVETTFRGASNVEAQQTANEQCSNASTEFKTCFQKTRSAIVCAGEAYQSGEGEIPWTRLKQQMAKRAAVKSQAPSADATSSPPSAPVATQATANITSCDNANSCVRAMLRTAALENLPAAEEAAKRMDSAPKPHRGDRVTARKLNKNALDALNQQRWDDAIALFRQAREADPADEEVVSNLAFAYGKAGLFDRSLDMAVMALAANPRRTSAWAPLAATLTKLNRPKEAVQAMWLAYQFSANKEKTVGFIESKIADENDPQLKAMYQSTRAWVVENKRPQ